MSLCNTNIKPIGFSEEVVLERLRRDYGLYSINNVQSNLNICTEIFNAPTYTSNLTKIMTGLTESSFGVFNVTENQVTFVYDFTGNTEFLSAYTGSFQYDIHKRNEEVSASTVNYLNGDLVFSSKNSFSESVDFSGITSNGYSGTTLLTLPTKDDEYILNSNFSFIKKNCLFKGETYTEPKLVNEYDSEKTKYFVTLVNPDKPSLGPFTTPPLSTPSTLTVRETTQFNGKETYIFSVPSQSEENSGCKLVNETLTINPIDGSLFSINTTPSPNTLLISVNGITLSESDYSISADTIIQLTQNLDPNRDIITASYLDCVNDLDTIYSEQYEVLSAITSGVTSAVTTTDKVYYNTEQSKYEYYLDYGPTDPEDTMTLFLNGIRLTYGVDYYMSITLSNRVIFDSIDLTINDIIYVVYSSDGKLEGDYETIGESTFLSWRVSPTIVNDRLSGEFIVDISESDDPNFTSTGVTTGITVSYVDGSSEYGVETPTTITAKKDYIWRVTSKKVYSGILDNIFTTSNVSRVGKFSTNNKILLTLE
jgi:hypothetical protein